MSAPNPQAMIGHVSLAVHDLPLALTFYDAIFSALGFVRSGRTPAACGCTGSEAWRRTAGFPDGYGPTLGLTAAAAIALQVALRREALPVQALDCAGRATYRIAMEGVTFEWLAARVKRVT